MINTKIYKTKILKLNDIFLPRAVYDKNIFRSNFLFNYSKFRHKKWKFQRSKYTFSDPVIFRRFAPNLSYVPNYSQYIVKPIDVDNIKINLRNQFLTYSAKLFLKKRLLGFFLFQKTKLLKKFMVFRHMNTHFNVFDTNLEVVLLRLGIANSIHQARLYIQQGILEINNHIVTQTRHLNHLDMVKLSRKPILFKIKRSVYDKKVRNFVLEYSQYFLDICNYITLIVLKNLSLIKPDQLFFDFLPWTSTFNFSRFSFIYFNFLMKNQWHFFIDFFIAKKFLQYAR
jgi:hypothetical protein